MLEAMDATQRQETSQMFLQQYLRAGRERWTAVELRGRLPFGAPIGSFEPSRCLLATTVATADMPTLQRKPSIHPLTFVLRERSAAISLLRAHC